jgi:hypothetical protein
MNKKGKILFFCMIFVSNAVIAQKAFAVKDNLLIMEALKNAVPKPFSGYSFKKSAVYPVPFLSPQFYSSQLGFFCRQEIKFDKITKIPFRFRLGSLAECDQLEGKGKR